MKYVVCFSGGHSSALAAIETVRKYGRNHTILLNHDISSKVENFEIKLYKRQVAEFLGLKITYANCDKFEEKTPLSLCMEHKTMKFRCGNEICTYFLKTEPFYKWLKNNYPVVKNTISDKITLVYGFDEWECNRIQRRREHLLKLGYVSAYPLVEWKRTICMTENVGIKRPLLYQEAKHANCMGCLKAGKQHWYRVYCRRPDIFYQGMEVEEALNYSIIKGYYLNDLEQDFEKLRRAGLPATESMDSYWFWRYAREIL